MAKAGAGSLLTAVILGSLTATAAFAQSFTSTAVASVQSQPAQPSAKDEPEREQSTNQIVKLNQKSFLVSFDRKPLEVNTFAPPGYAAKLQKVHEPELEAEAPTAVIPPAPLIVKRNTTAIMIPVARASLDSMGPDSKYTERPAVSSSVSVGSVFGYRRDPFTRRARFHAGVDIKARRGDPVGASQAGTVQFAGWYHGYGNMIIVNHGGGVATHYAHLSSFDVEVGARVERGTIIGRAGSTGRATSPHLHYELRIDGSPMNPFQPLALDPSSDYFKPLRPTVDAGRGDATAAAGSQRDN